MTQHNLLDLARSALDNAVAPYSSYPVGAALETEDRTYAGCNLEVANYSNTLHAEEVAIGSALANGATEFQALAISTDRQDGATPCGMCRQTLWEFCPPEMPIYCDTGDGYDEYTLEELLPAAFTLEEG